MSEMCCTWLAENTGHKVRPKIAICASSHRTSTILSGSIFATKARWRLGVVASVVRRMNEVTLRRAQLVLGWVTVFGRVYHHGM